MCLFYLYQCSSYSECSDVIIYEYYNKHKYEHEVIFKGLEVEVNIATQIKFVQKILQIQKRGKIDHRENQELWVLEL